MSVVVVFVYYLSKDYSQQHFSTSYVEKDVAI